jgi:TPR repeat protein
MDDELELARAQGLFDAFVRGDALIGLMPDPDAATQDLMDTAWALAGRGNAAACTLLGRCYLACEHPVGAFDGVLPSGDEFFPLDPVVPLGKDTPVGAALRCFVEAARRGDRDGLLLLARVARRTDDETRALAQALLGAHAGPDADGTFAYEGGLLRWWSGDVPGAIAAYETAAGKGNGDAAFELSLVHSTGEALPPDEAAARRWLERAAALGQPRALYNLGAFHATGQRGFPQDWDRAVACYTTSAERGNPRAATTLATMYLVGDGVAPDAAAAARWLGLAEALGVDTAGLLADLGLPDPR